MSEACGPPTELSTAAQAQLVAALQQSLRAAHADAPVELIETHISFVLLTPQHAYKIKKAVNLGFVDFTSLERRHFFCQEELRLNRRTAPALYLDVLPVTGTPEQPALGGAGTAIDWALHMRAFAQDDLWDRLAARGALQPRLIDELADELCALHRGAAVAAADDPAGQAAQVRAPMSDNLHTLDGLCDESGERDSLARLREWEAAAFAALRECFDERARDGWVRECHGDLHLGNVTLVDGRSTLFDCLEFSAALRWTDVMSDVAFMAMDLQSHGLARLAQRFVNGVVERSGDAGGLRVLRYYRVHRALVRAKVAALRAAQLDARSSAAQRAAALDALRHYLDVALACSRHAPPVLMLTHGLSGSGKTLLTQSLLELCGAVRFRADVERKRLFGLDALARSDPAARARLYSSQATEATQARLRELAALALGSGYSVILDATFMGQAQRERARALADGLHLRFVIIDFQASADTLRERVRQRTLRADDASDADLQVLEDQLAHAQPLLPQEQAAVFAFDAEPAFDEQRMAARWAPLLHRLGLTAA